MKLFCIVINSLICLQVFAQEDALLGIVEKELEREISEFAEFSNPPYYLAYRISDVYSHYITSSFGSLISSNGNRDRVMVTDVRVGDYNLDNTHPKENNRQFDIPFEMDRQHSVKLPLDNRQEALRFVIWQQTQQMYRQSLSRFKEVRNQNTTDKKLIADFSKEEPYIYVEAPLRDFTTFFDEKDWIQRLKKISKSFLNHPDIVDGDASIDIGMERKYLLSSEGSRIVQNRTYAYLTIRGTVRADDGDIVPLHQSYFAFEPAGLPTDDLILADVATMIGKLNQLRTVPVAEPYTGPAILYSRAAGVFFHEIFGHRIEGHRLKDKTDGQTFKGKVGEQVLPKTLNIVFDPTMKSHNGQDLNGYYQYDDEGVKSKRINVVEKGLLKSFLMSRTPIENFTKSNGHGRAEAGAKAVSRQSNLFVENSDAVSMDDLRKMLIEECKKQNKKYGYLFMDVVGGFTNTGRYMPNAFNIFPTEVYRIYVDKRPDELVRGVDLIGTPLAMFAEITAAGDKSEVFTGFCGAESGNVPVTAISPSLFVKRIETQKKPSAQVEKPILKMPN
ncbi:MAG: hypothetical protein KDC93_15285 [Cyclobacteriaceae bacterium]|nr:hypothetical protein [Cyclobacteriaceae bacterium]